MNFGKKNHDKDSRQDFSPCQTRTGTILEPGQTVGTFKFDIDKQGAKLRKPTTGEVASGAAQKMDVEIVEEVEGDMQFNQAG